MKRLLRQKSTAKRSDPTEEPRADSPEGSNSAPEEAAIAQQTTNERSNGSRGFSAARLFRSDAHSASYAAPRTGSNPQQVVVAIGWLCGSGNDDWETVLRLCDNISTSTELAKEAARALRRELEHGQPEPQQRAARLLVLMSRNGGDRFRLQLAQKKMLDVIEKLIKSTKTMPAVKEMLQKSLSVLAYENQSDRDLAPLVGLYNRLRGPDDPWNGSEEAADDPIFSPTELPRRHRSRPAHPGRPTFDLRAEAQNAISNAALLSEALAFTKPEDLHTNEIVSEFYGKCQESQSRLVDAVPEATRKVEDSRRARGLLEPFEEGSAPANADEEVLVALTSANRDLTAAFRMYDDMQRKRREEEDEREARQRSMQDSRHDDTLNVPYHGPIASGSSENLDQVGTSGADHRVESTRLAPALLAEPVPAPASPPRSTNPYMLPSLPAVTPPRPSNPFVRQPLPAGASFGNDELSLANGHGTVSDGVIVEEPDMMTDQVAHSTSNPYLARSGPPRSPSAGFNPYSSMHQSKGSNGSTSSNTSSTNPYLASQFAAQRPANTGEDELLATPIEPSLKALGKLRRMSVRDEDGVNDTETRQQVLEEQLRQRYVSHYEEKARQVV